MILARGERTGGVASSGDGGVACSGSGSAVVGVASRTKVQLRLQLVVGAAARKNWPGQG